MTKVFVSHSSQDRAWVEQEVIALLNSHGIETWYSQDDIKTGAQWEREIQRALSTCDWFLIVLSRHSAHSEWVKDELHLAIDNAPERIVPVMMERCNPADFHIRLARIQHVDFCGDARARHKLVERFGVVPQEDVLDARGGGPSDSAVARPGPERPAPALGTKAGPALGVPPFHFGGVVPPEYFTDRREELREAERIVRGRQSLLLVGEHRAGKTSFCKMLIHQMMNAPNNDLLAVYVNVQTWPVVTIGTFLEHTILNMIGEIARQVFGCKYMALAASDPMAEYPALREDELFRAFVDRYRLIRKRTYADGPSAPAPFQAQEFVRFHHELSEIVRDKGWGNSVIFYDEANRLPRELSVELLLSHEEALSMAGITSVFAASPAMLEAFEELQDSFGHQLHLGPFRERSDMQRLLARYCFHDASRTMDIPLSSSALELLWRLSQGKPFLIQLIAGESFKQAAHRGDQVVDDRHVQEAHSLLRRTKPRAFTGPP